MRRKEAFRAIKIGDEYDQSLFFNVACIVHRVSGEGGWLATSSYVR